MAERRYVPSFTERTGYGSHESNPYDKLYGERIVFLGTQVDDMSANDIMSQLLWLEGDDPDRDIHLYINSPGGSNTALMAIYDTMSHVRPDVETVCLGQAASAAAVLLAAGAPGKRFALPNAKVLIHQPAMDAVRGQASDLEIQAAEMRRVREQLETALASHTGRPVERIHDDIERDMVLTAEEAVAYGIVDTVMPYRKLSGRG
ncbi:MAG TPA: ATP-dependent Clp protease proteolytic subunit [Pseudonocardiaceae bacterium]|jgi:ATP-dependent Clp protease protease subunit|nr:ATP-dependent Clp protease proteolytic subunit [Pseudonocardiaceae bacterium]